MKMRRDSAIPSLIVVAFLLAPFAFFGGPAGAATITTFGNGSSDATLTFPTGGEDTSLYISVPKMSTVTSATITIEGQDLRSATSSSVDFDFNDTDNNGMWSATTNQDVAVTANGPGQFQGGAQGAAELTKVAVSDDSRHENVNKGANYAYTQFKFTVDMVEITEIVVEWEGMGEYNDMISPVTNYGARVFLWDNGTEGWVAVGEVSGDDGSKDAWIKNTYSGSLDDYIYNDREIRVIATTYDDANGGYAGLLTDFVKIKVTGKTTEWPTDIEVDIGDNGNIDWEHAGALMEEDTFAGANFVTALNILINAEGAGHGTFDIPLSFSTATPGKLYISGVNIVLSEYVNLPPELDPEVPSTFQMNEDSTAVGLIDLKHYFDDDIDAVADLAFELYNESDPNLLHATVNADGTMDFATQTDDWFGTATFQIKATDTDAAFTLSNVFTVTVKPVNDPPELNPIGPLSFDENERSVITVSATDPDKLYGGTDTFSYTAFFTSGKSLFNMAGGTGTATFIPTDADVGVYTINFTVTDKTDLTDSEVVTMTINDVNNPPDLKPVGKKVLNEDEPFELQLEASDIDASDADALSFSVTFPESDPLFTMDTDGYVSFTPVQEHVGTHKVRFEVKDSGDLKDSEDVMFEIRNVNDAPVLADIDDQKVDRNDNFYLKVEATDEDLDYVQSEFLEFTDNTELFDIDPETGEMNFTPTLDEVGTYTITITVTDLIGAKDMSTFVLEVVLKNSAPDASIEVEDNKTKVKEGRSVTLHSVATDEDGDEMTYKWVERNKKGDEELGTEVDLTIANLKAGTHKIVLQVSDGIETTEVEQEIKVEAEGGKSPGFGSGLSIVALGIALVGLLGRRRNR